MASKKWNKESHLRNNDNYDPSKNIKVSTSLLTSKKSNQTALSSPSLATVDDTEFEPTSSVIELESSPSRSDSPDFFYKFKENVKDKFEDIYRVYYVLTNFGREIERPNLTLSSFLQNYFIFAISFKKYQIF